MRVIHRISESTSNARELMELLDLYNVLYRVSPNFRSHMLIL